MRSKEDQTLKLSMIEGALYTLAFNSTQGFVYSTLAVHMGFSPVMVSVIAVLPTTSQLAQFFAPVVYRLIPSKKTAISWLAFLSRSVFILLPMLLISGTSSPLLAAVPFLVFNVLHNLYINLWSSAMRSLVQEENRSTYFGARNTVATFAGLVGWLLYSSLLQNLSRETGLLLCYTVSSILFLVSALVVARHNFPETRVTEFSIVAPLRTLRNRRFRDFLLFVVVWNFATQFAGPFFSYFEVSHLRVPYSMLGLLNLLGSAVTMVAYTFFGRVTKFFGEKNMIRFGISLTFISLTLYVLMNPRNYVYVIWFSTAIASTAWSVINLCYFTLLLKLSEEPPELYLATHAAVSGLSALAASYLGGVTLNFIKRSFEFSTFSPYNVMFFLTLLLRIASFVHFSRLDLRQDKRDMRVVEVGYRIITGRY